MVKISILSIASVAAFASFGAAKNCQTQFNYCAWALLTRGNYQAQIDNALDDAHIPRGDQDKVLFACTGGPNGAIAVLDVCGSVCKNGGNGHTDSC